MDNSHVHENEKANFEQGEQSGDLPGAAPDESHPLEDVVTVFFKKERYRIPAGCYTTEQLIAEFPIEPGYLLNLKVDGELVTLKPGQEICLKDGMHFYSQVPGGGSS